MDEDDFKYSDWRCLPDSVTIIAPCKKTDNYAVKFDTAENIALSLYDFSKAYFQSANIIASRMIDKEQIDELDKYVFPLFFLYRHSLELLLKSIGFSFIIDNSQRQLFLKETFHNLRTIYEYILKYTTCPRNAEEQQWLLTYFGNIEKSDSESDSFRYPFHIIVNYSERRARVFRAC